MTLPKREYFYLPEIVQKLGITEFDLQYYMSHGEIMGAFWINKAEFLQENFDVFKGGYVGARPFSYEGYVILFPNDCREVVNTGHAYVRSFLVDDETTRITRQEDQPGILVRRSNLMVSLWDFTFFAEKYLFEPVLKKAGGRPSIMPFILAEYDRRRMAGESYKSRMREAQALHDWACVYHKDDTPPMRDSIRNALIEHDKKKKDVA